MNNENPAHGSGGIGGDNQEPIALDAKLKSRNLPPEWSDIIISEAQNSEPEYQKTQQDELPAHRPGRWLVFNPPPLAAVRTRPVGALLALIEAYGTRCYAAVGRKSFLASLMLKAQLGGNSEAA